LYFASSRSSYGEVWTNENKIDTQLLDYPSDSKINNYDVIEDEDEDEIGIIVHYRDASIKQFINGERVNEKCFAVVGQDLKITNPIFGDSINEIYFIATKDNMKQLFKLDCDEIVVTQISNNGAHWVLFKNAQGIFIVDHKRMGLYKIDDTGKEVFIAEVKDNHMSRMTTGVYKEFFYYIKPHLGKQVVSININTGDIKNGITSLPSNYFAVNSFGEFISIKSKAKQKEAYIVSFENNR